MASAKKILASMRKNAKNWRIEDLQTLAKHYGIAYRQNGTSHVFSRSTLFTFDPFHVRPFSRSTQGTCRCPPTGL
jgi:hypothetical protein